MDSTIVLVYCLCDDLLKWQKHREDVQCHLSDAEVMTIGLVAALYFDGNHSLSALFLTEQGYMGRQLSRSRLCRRLQRVRVHYAALFAILGEFFKAQNQEQLYLLDSMPVAVCDPYRIRHCRIYRMECYRGYQASKKRWVYGLKIHLMVTKDGEPVEFFLTPAASSDTACLLSYNFDLPPGAQIFADKAYNYGLAEDLLEEYGIDLSPIRKSNSKRPDPPWLRYLQAYHRKRIETTNSQVEHLLPKHIHAVTAAGFETKVALFVLATSINCLTC